MKTTQIKKRYTGRLVLLLAVGAAVLQAVPVVAQDGGTQSPFSLGAGSRGISLGRAFVSSADDASAIYWNPAALRNVQSKQFMAMYMPVFGDFTDADYTFFGAVYPTLGAGSIGVGFMRIATTFDGFDEFSRPTGEGDYSESQVMIGYAAERQNRWVFGTLAAGVSFKIVNQNITPFSSTSPGLDVGLRWVPDAFPGLALGLNMQDIIGGEHKLDEATDITYSTFMTGAGYTKQFAGGSALRLMLQVDLPERADSRFHAGVEYAFSQYISLRAGLDDGDVNFGLGMTVSQYGLDYAFLSRDEAGSSHPVSFTTQIGRTLYEQRQILAERRAEEERQLIEQVFGQRVEAARGQAKSLESQGDYIGALDAWQIVLEYLPEDEEALARSQAARQEILRRQEAATLDRENQAIIRTRFEQGLAAYEERDYRTARAEWRAILAIDSTHADAQEYLANTQERIDAQVAGHVTRARRLEQQGRLTEAIGEWNNVQLYEPDNATAARAVERIRRQIENVSQDYAAAQRRLRIVTLYNDALQLFNDESYESAINNLEQLLRLDATHEEARNLLAQARRKLTPLTENEKAEIRKLYLAGMQHFSKDEYNEAIVEWEKILVIDPTNESVKNNIKEAKERLRQLSNGR